MKRLILSATALALIALSTAPASTFTFTNDPTQFNDGIDWCQLGGCTSSYAFVDTPTPWVSTSGGLTGGVGAFYSTDQIVALQQGVGWNGGFKTGTGLLWNWPGTFGNDIAITFDRPVYGAGAYVDPDTPGSFEASIFFFNNVYNITSSYTWSITDGQLGTGPGTALYIGGFSSTPDVYGAIFEVCQGTDPTSNAACFGSDPTLTVIDFALGQAGVQAIPEPATMLLVGGSILSLCLVLRRKRRS